LEIKIFKEFDSIKNDWITLYNKGNIFNLNYEWCKYWWDIFHKPKTKLYIITIYKKNSIKLIFPAYKINNIIFPIGMGPTLYDEFNLLYTDIKYVKYLLNYIIENNFVLKIHYLNASSDIAKYITRYIKQNRLLYKRKIVDNMPQIKNLANFTFNKKLKYDYKRLSNKFEKLELQISYDTDKFFEMHKKRWNGGPLIYIKNYQKFLEKLITKNVGINLKLNANNKVLSYHFGIIDSNNTFNSIIHTYNIDFKNLSVGKLNLFKTIEFIKNQNIENFSFGRGVENYKYWFANYDNILFHIILIGKASLKNKLLINFINF